MILIKAAEYDPLTVGTMLRFPVALLMPEDQLLHRITLHLARCTEYPEGSARHGYEIIAPLDKSGLLDADEWRSKRNFCRVRRFWGDEGERHGILVHRAGGSGGASWVIDYDPNRATDDEAGYRLSKHRFVPGEYVSIQDEDDKLHTFQVVTVQEVKLASTGPGA